ncbi:hypothetical protein CNX65_20380 [Actinosynnema pretiosum]|uniref:Peptidoglycan binding-like domain-containing protein n=2 Tax=Actinosynnema pretiosum TaxID=42197 RepID=A0A290Z8M3_9PSEU|nr:hypothetical protein CNX65_20380 [Actinosynnema pretiosum]
MPAKLRRMSKTRSRAVVAAVVALAVVTGAAVLLLRPDAPQADPSADRPDVETATVERTDLTNTRSLRGTLGFGAPKPVKGGGAGTVTALPQVGATAERGKALHRVDDRPVPVFFGATPLFRKLEEPGVKGSDVAVVMDNLAALGYTVGIRPDDDSKAEFTPRVVEALKKWQRKAGLPDTGKVEPGQVLVLAGPVRVSSVTAQPGAVASEELFQVTPTGKVVVLQVSPTEAGAVSQGAKVLLTRPDGRDVLGTISSVGTAVSGEQGQGAGPQIEVVATPDRNEDVADLDSAPVQVKITTERREGVLSVPLEALVALREGGYAVQSPGGALKAVETGMHSQSRVEISGPDVVEGMVVVVAR